MSIIPIYPSHRKQEDTWDEEPITQTGLNNLREHAKREHTTFHVNDVRKLLDLIDAQEKGSFWGRAAARSGQEVRRLEDAIREIEDRLLKMIPDHRYMDPPDGGNVTPIEQVERMVSDLKEQITNLNYEIKESGEFDGD